MILADQRKYFFGVYFGGLDFSVRLMQKLRSWAGARWSGNMRFSKCWRFVVACSVGAWCWSSLAYADDAVVKQYLAAALSPAGNPIPSTQSLDLDKQLTPESTRGSWSRLKSCRDAGESLNLDLAAAEHYLFARYLAADSGDTSYRHAPGWYESFKSMSSNEAFRAYIRTSDQPVSPVAPETRRWGEAGVEAGLKDYQSRTGKQPSAGLHPVLGIIGIAAAIYYKSKSADCDVLISPVGVWESTDPDKRWQLTFTENAVEWTEKRTSTSLSRSSSLTPMILDRQIRIERANDDECLKFLDMSDPMRAAIAAKEPQPSYMLIRRDKDSLQAEWYGLVATKGADGKFKELRQPGSSPAKQYTFKRK